MRPNFKFYDLQPRDGSHYLLENGEPIARFNELEKAEAVRAGLAAEIAAMYERNADRFTFTPSEQGEGPSIGKIEMVRDLVLQVFGTGGLGAAAFFAARSFYRDQKRADDEE
jgi:hypothetical protein